MQAHVTRDIPDVHTRKRGKLQQYTNKLNHCKVMFLDVPDKLRLVPSLIDKVVVWSLDIMLPFLDNL